MACCENCIHAEVERDSKTIGANSKIDVYCHYWKKWVGLGGSCSEYKD